LKVFAALPNQRTPIYGLSTRNPKEGMLEKQLVGGYLYVVMWGSEALKQ